MCSWTPLIRTGLFIIPCYFELETIILGFALLTYNRLFQIKSRNLSLNQNVRLFPLEHKRNRKKQKRSDSSDSDSIELVIPLMTAILASVKAGNILLVIFTCNQLGFLVDYIIFPIFVYSFICSVPNQHDSAKHILNVWSQGKQ